MSLPARIAVLVAVVIALLVSGCGDDGGTGPDDRPDEGTVITLEFEDGELVGGSRQESVGLGDAVEITVAGDPGDDVHVHGYDLYIREGEDQLTFDALIPGTFEVELEGSGRQLLRMTVS
ncbi:MAG: hypothetical protein DHS20C19_28030 [Acidimicrobiales bacterium]|nr:MAG: hypothetical protein DHS20C19_28030 [Acidimicrobiales bacterium]